MSHTPINPATGLPMIDDAGCVDVGGNPYGTSIHTHHNPWSSPDFGWVGDRF
ncbi:hypothetical protein [Burkholderia vietnamiensis]|uniref:hypothetical protein n=1 Tax=Burkholderia vietnamiensis TaxID=60552 RepID=UPI00158FAFCE|nr:hypothetical protein [Burkholderia vietnamiensis]